MRVSLPGIYLLGEEERSAAFGQRGAYRPRSSGSLAESVQLFREYYTSTSTVMNAAAPV
jgi:hypothetical protein